jgi:GxxExxY protein
MNANALEKNKIIYPELSYKIVGILFKVHSELGNKYQEKYYQRAIAIELEKQGILFKKELMVDLMYDNEKIGKYFIDFLIEDLIVLEIKANINFRISDYKQVSAYLKSKDIKLGILANFRTEQLIYKRIINPQINNYSH